ncbi:MAG TPA: hypothetical protein PKD53_31985 [Chloroflexaceae bacterium]|nr:hypothetical protein [Chloroflexaceae bacterium]
MELDPHTLARGRIAVRSALPLLLDDPNIGLVDFGLREQRGALTTELALRCHVRQKFRTRASLEAAIARGATSVNLSAIEQIAGFPVDIVEGRYRAAAWGWPPRPRSPRAARMSPMRGGISISTPFVDGYGTLGGRVIDRATGAELMLSNWHVLVGDWRPRREIPIYQPGTGDGGGPADAVARVLRDAMGVGIDAAVAALTGERPLVNDQLGVGPVTGLAAPALGTVVVKSGRASDVTTGLVTGVEGVQLLSYAGIERLIRHVVAIDPLDRFGEVSRPGDSGSFWLERATRRAVALHFAGGNHPERALGIAMEQVLDALGVSLAPVRELQAPAPPPPARPAPRRPAEPPPWSLWSPALPPARRESHEPHHEEPRLSPKLVEAIERAGLLAEHSFDQEPPENGRHGEGGWR